MRPRTITLLSLPPVCEVCAGEERMRITDPGNRGRRPGDPRVGVPVPCPHCAWSIPVLHLPMRGEG
jgi:hypothetical protein